MKEKIYLGLMGLGTVGSSVYRIINEKREKIKQEIGVEIVIKRILEKDFSKADKVSAPLNLLTKDPNDLLNDPEIEIVIELIGGMEPAKTFILEAIEKGKNIVTANKELMANYGQVILESAARNKVDVYFEASVGGGIPIIKPLKESLAGNKIKRVMGIVNGTTNYILSRMSDEGCSFEEALKEAQKKGYAEADPTADVEGHDAAAKIAILASIAFNSRVVASQVYTEGIQGITPADIMYANELGYVIKLLALAEEEFNGIDVRVHPTMIPNTHPLAAVKGVYNAIFVEGDVVGEVMFFGQGAGGMAAGSSVVGDVVEVAQNIKWGATGKIGCTCFEKKLIKSIEEIRTRYYLLMNVADKPGVLAKIAKAFGDNNVSLASVIQKGSYGESADVMFTTHLTSEKDLREALKEIKGLDVVNKVSNVIRVEVS